MHYIKANDSWIQNPDSGFLSKIFRMLKFSMGVKNKTKLEIEFWYLELDDNGRITREIAVDKRNQIVEIAPFLQHRGQWTDSNVTLNSAEFEQISKSKFDLIWKEHTKI